MGTGYDLRVRPRAGYSLQGTWEHIGKGQEHGSLFPFQRVIALQDPIWPQSMALPGSGGAGQIQKLGRGEQNLWLQLGACSPPQQKRCWAPWPFHGGQNKSEASRRLLWKSVPPPKVGHTIPDTPSCFSFLTAFLEILAGLS